jgi:hypothetical protein
MSLVYLRGIPHLSGENFTSGRVKLALLKTGTAAPTTPDAAVLADISPLAEFDGIDYERIPIVDPEVLYDDVAGTVTYAMGTAKWENVGGGTGPIAGVLMYLHNTDDTDSIPLIFWDKNNLPSSHPGGDILVGAPDGVIRWSYGEVL